MSLSMQVSRSEFRGDPGLFGFLGKAAKSIGGRIFRASPVGAAIGTTLGLLTKKKLAQQERQLAARARAGRPPPALPGIGFNLPFAGAPGAGVPLPFGGGRLSIGESRGAAAATAGTQLACPPGFHPNKSDYCTKTEGWVAEGTKCVRNRRRNPLNPGAASKAISRIAAAKRATKSLGRVTIRKSCD